MENNIKDLVAQVTRESGVATIPAVAPLPVERTFVQALEGTKIKNAETVEIKTAVSAAIEKAWLDLGLKPIPDKDFLLLKSNIFTELTSCFGCLTLNEIGNAIYHGARGKYGKVYGITVIGVAKWFADYLTDQHRLEAVQSIKPKELPAPKPSDDKLWELDKKCLWLALDKYNQKTPMGTLAPTVYNFLNKIGLIIYGKNEKWAFMVLALDVAIEELRIAVIKEIDEHKRAGFKKQLNILLAAKEPDAPLSDPDCKQIVINKAKELTLADWFDDCRESGFDIEELVEGKRGNYIGIS